MRWAKGDWGSAEWADPDIEFEIVGGLEEGRWRGVAEMAESWATRMRAWKDLRAVPDDIREVDDERVLVLLRNQGSGKGSGIEIDEIAARSANIFTVREGKVVRLVLYWDRERAFEDLGLAS